MSQTRPKAPARSLRTLEQARRADGTVRRAARPGRPAIRRRALVVVIWAGLGVMFTIWWQQTPAASMVGTAALLSAGGRLAGLTGGYLLLVQVLLMSRVPAIDAAVSGGRRSIWHRDLGAYVIGVICLHIVLITLGYAATARTGVWHEAWTLLTTNQDMISAVVAFGLMVVLALVAIRSIRTRLPYGLWHTSHLGTYLILLFVYGHQFADGQQFVLSHAAAVYWACLYFVVIGAVIYGRLIEPVRLNLRHQLRVAAVVAEAPGVTSIYLTGRRLDRFPAIAGQFVRLRFLDGGRWWRSHPFSLSAAPHGAWLRVTVKGAGDFSGGLASVAPGARVLAEAPSGEFTADHRVRDAALLIAGGSGIAPVRAIVETLPPGATVLYRARTPEDFVFKDELDKLTAARRLRVHYIAGSRSEHAPAALATPEGLRELVPDIAERDVYVCGPLGLRESVHRVLLELRVPPKQIHLDPFEL